MAGGPPLILTIDEQNAKLVGFLGSPTSIRDLFQYNTVGLIIRVVDPAASAIFPQVSSAQYTVVNLNGFGMRVVVGDAPAGTAGQVPLAGPVVMTWDPVNQYFTGDLALNTANIDSFLGGSPIKTAYFEVTLTGNAARETILQATFNLKATVDESSSNAPAPTNQYLTSTETAAQFMPLKGAPGQTFIMVSPNGVYQTEFGVDNSGQAFAKPIQ